MAMCSASVSLRLLSLGARLVTCLLLLGRGVASASDVCDDECCVVEPHRNLFVCLRADYALASSYGDSFPLHRSVWSPVGIQRLPTAR